MPDPVVQPAPPADPTVPPAEGAAPPPPPDVDEVELAFGESKHKFKKAELTEALRYGKAATDVVQRLIRDGHLDPQTGELRKQEVSKEEIKVEPEDEVSLLRKEDENLKQSKNAEKIADDLDRALSALASRDDFTKTDEDATRLVDIITTANFYQNPKGNLISIHNEALKLVRGLVDKKVQKILADKVKKIDEGTDGPGGGGIFSSDHKFTGDDLKRGNIARHLKKLTKIG